MFWSSPNKGENLKLLTTTGYFHSLKNEDQLVIVHNSPGGNSNSLKIIGKDSCQTEGTLFWGPHQWPQLYNHPLWYPLEYWPTWPHLQALRTEPNIHWYHISLSSGFQLEVSLLNFSKSFRKTSYCRSLTNSCYWSGTKVRILMKKALISFKGHWPDGILPWLLH